MSIRRRAVLFMTCSIAPPLPRNGTAKLPGSPRLWRIVDILRRPLEGDGGDDVAMGQKDPLRPFIATKQEELAPVRGREEGRSADRSTIRGRREGSVRVDQSTQVRRRHLGLITQRDQHIA